MAEDKICPASIPEVIMPRMIQAHFELPGHFLTF